MASDETLLDEGDSKKVASAFRTIGEVSQELSVPQHVLRFWEKRFSQITPVKRRGRRYYRPEDIDILKCIKNLLYKEGYTIKGVQKFLVHADLSGLSTKDQPDLFTGVIANPVSNSNVLNTVELSENNPSFLLELSNVVGKLSKVRQQLQAALE